MPEPDEYTDQARKQMASRRSGVLKKLKAIVARPVQGEERTLRFDLSWGLYNNAFVEVWPRDESGEATTERRPFGGLLEVSPPPDREDDPDAFAEDRQAIAQLVADALAGWWE